MMIKKSNHFHLNHSLYKKYQGNLHEEKSYLSSKQMEIQL